MPSRNAEVRSLKKSRQALVLLALTVVAIAIASRFIGWVGAIFAVGIWNFIFWLATKPDSVPAPTGPQASVPEARSSSGSKLVFLIINILALVAMSQFLGWIGALVAVAISIFIFWLATKPDPVPVSLTTQVEIPETEREIPVADELLSIKLAYKLGGRCSQFRRIFTLTSIALWVLLIPVALIPGLSSSLHLEMIFGWGWGPLAFMLAVIAEALRDIRFRRKAPELYQRFSIWQPSDGSAEVTLYRRAVYRRWLTGKDPDWYKQRDDVAITSAATNRER